ncbi:hypothetical protein E6W39_00050 [Kitasatospora acidiphila]|uniref:Uncharacterized protein n=1 Tax=Kitasatospora acidiphila TaxID=2567942 RepID=A0A540VYY0_9ACTN|nr:Mur ligase domain-containing protein [Kitasatospora acidiphila]TQF01976.1 hypothetical protein E6W39_06425 [Kitasatospora acidiphila]TQF07997.1 hypothetical protein E6W39_00050 [Kitasatospora acidiphila]
MSSTLALPAPSCGAEPPSYLTILLAGTEHDTTASLTAVSDEALEIVEEYADIASDPGFATKTICAWKGRITIGDVVVLLFALPTPAAAWRRWTDLLDGATAALLVTDHWPVMGTDPSALDVFEQRGIPHLIAITNPPSHNCEQSTEPELLRVTGACPPLTRVAARPHGVGHRVFLVAAALEAINQDWPPPIATIPQEKPRMNSTPNAQPLLTVPHLVGIDAEGSGLPGLAELLLARGARVSGSTNATTDTPAINALRGLGAVIHPHSSAPVRADMACLIWPGPTTKAARAELDRARALGIPALTVAEALGELIGCATTVMVAGSHSTATVSGMLTSALGHRNPAWMLRRPVTGQRLGHHSGGDLLIADLAQDYDLAVRTEVSVITAASATRLDRLDDELEELEGIARRSEAVVLPTWEAGVGKLAARLAAQPGPRVVTVGQAGGADVRILDSWRNRSGTRLRLRGLDGTEYELTVPVMGRQAARDAAMVVAAGQLLGVAVADLAEGVADFSGIARSLTVAGKPNGITVLDSVAVHPVELAHDLAVARELTDHRGRVIALFEPSGWPATVANGRELGRQLAAADHAFLLPVYDPSGAAHPGFPSGVEAIARAAAHQGIADHLHVMPSVQAVLSHELERQIADLARPGDVIAVVGSGYATQLAERLLAALATPVPANR